MKSTVNSIFGYSIIGLSVLFGGGALALFTAFLYLGSLRIVHLDIGFVEALLLDALLCLIFFIQHSGMIRERSRQGISKVIPPHYYGSFFALSSGMALSLLVILWQESGATVVIIEGAARSLLRVAFILSLVGLWWSARSLRSFDIFGKDQILAHMRNKQLREMPFAVRGPYRYIRHPFYSFMLLMIWSCPDITLDRLLFNCLWSIWVVAGTVLEERDLIVYFGEKYKDYQKEVPMLIPWRVCSGVFGKG